jgi:oligopeptide transport system ATP-binding protein
MDKNIKLQVEDLTVSFKTTQGMVRAVRGINFELYEGETLAIVGESGSGKSVSSRTIMGILAGNGVIDKGSILYEGQDLTEVDEEHFHEVRGNKIGMIFQDPMSSLNPIMRIGKQITEGMVLNGKRLTNRVKKLYQLEKNKYTEITHKKEKLQRNIKKDYELISEGLYNENLEELNNLYQGLNSQLKEAAPEAKAELKVKIQEAKSKLNNAQAQLKQNLKQEYQVAIAELNKQLPAAKKAMEKAKKNAKAKVKQEWKDEKAKYAAKIAAVRGDTAKKAKADAEAAKEQAILNKLNSQLVALQEKFNKDIEKAERDKDKQTLKDAYREEKNAIKSLIRQSKTSLRAAQKAIALEIEGLKEELRRYKKVTNKEAKERALKIMTEVGIPQPDKRFKQYPFQFSGGMRQRIVIAIALTANPDILICDEPTTALDVTIQAQILELINDLKRERNLSVIFITHDLGVVANMANRIAVMYAGKIVEIGTAEDIFYNPRHPYTWALLSSMPDIMSKERLTAIPGTPPNMLFPPKGDAFADRNSYAMKIDFELEPPMFKISDTHYAATWLLHKDAPKVEMPEVVKNRIERMLEHTKEVTK